MIEQISTFFTIEMIYLWLNFGILPFWFILMFFPQSKVCGILVTSIFPFFILAAVYCYLLYYYFIGGYDFDQNFIKISDNKKNSKRQDSFFKKIVLGKYFFSINFDNFPVNKTIIIDKATLNL